MKNLERLIQILRQHKGELAQSYGVRELAIFGSHVRGEATAESDLDILVEFDDPPSFFRFLQLEQYLSDLLGGREELVTRQALKPHIGKYILQEALPI